MQDLNGAFTQAFAMIVAADPALLEIVWLSAKVSLLAVLVAALIGMPLGAWLALTRFRGRRLVVVVLNALMGLPPVVVGLLVYITLSRSGPLGVLGLLYTPTAMVIAQVVLVTPIIAAISRQTIQDLDAEYRELLRLYGLAGIRAVPTLLFDARASLVTAMLAGFGRAIAEVGAVLIVGGNIDHVTRVMTTAIALETSRGNLSLALALGLILMLSAIAVNALVSVAQAGETARHG